MSSCELVNMDHFNPPRRRGIADPLLEKARLHELTPELLEETKTRVEAVFDLLIQQLETEGAPVETYAQGVIGTLSDCCTLIFYGLDEMRDPARLRLGRLLIEKGEEEYLGVLAELKREEQAESAPERGVNLWGTLTEKLAGSGPDESREALALARTAFRTHLEGAQRDFERAIDLLTSDPETAERRMLVSLIRFHEFLGLEP